MPVPKSHRTTRPGRALAGFLGFATGAGLVMVLQFSSVAQACACGAFAQPVEADGTIELHSEVALVSLQEGLEQIDMRLGVDSITNQTGLIVPTPTPAQVSLGSMTEFTALSKEMTPEHIRKDLWWSTDPKSDGGAAAPPGSADSPSEPVVLDRVYLGQIEATILAASDAKGLTEWLSDNKYGLREEITDLLGHYVEKGWAFVAMKLVSDDPLDGDLAPIRFEFESDRMVYPMILSQAAPTTQYVTLYVFGDHRQDVVFVGGGAVPQNVTWARDVRNATLAQRGAYLTAISMTFADPATSISDDLELVVATSDEEVGTVVITYAYMTLFGIPAGWLLVGAGAAVVAIVLLLTVLPRKGTV